MRLTLAVVLFLFALVSNSQVKDIKEKSKENSSDRSSGTRSSDNGSSSNFNITFVFDAFRLFGQWQKDVLARKSEVPGLLGWDFMAHGAFQPSRYYTFNPRIRGNWGIFSTDFRSNYLLEQSINGNSDLITYDWQVLQLNFVNSKHAIVRAGAGFMKEGYADHIGFFESGLSSNFSFGDTGWGGFVEYRTAKDFQSEAVPRREFTLQGQREIIANRLWHCYLTGGLQFQRYYSSINVWGIQFGIVVRLYRTAYELEKNRFENQDEF